MTWTYFILQFIFATLATIGFCYYFKTPKHIILAAGIIGGVGWFLNVLLGHFLINSLIVTLLATLVVGISGEIIARKYHAPATTIIYPAITPLVPGAGMYYTMFSLLNEEYISFIKHASNTFIIAAGIAFGVTLALSLSRLIFNPLKTK